MGTLPTRLKLHVSTMSAKPRGDTMMSGLGMACRVVSSALLRSWVVVATLAVVSPVAVADEHIDVRTRAKCAIERAYCLHRLSPDSETAQLSEDEKFERFQLFDSCRSMRLAVVDSQSGSTDINLSKDSIRDAVESRLRSARLYDSAGSSVLEISVAVSGAAFEIGIRFYKKVLDYSSNIVYRTPTWALRSVGTHGKDSDYIYSNVSRVMDTFLVQYLRINEAKCGMK